MNEAQIEKEIQDKGLNAPRLTPTCIDDQIVSVISGRASTLFKDVECTPSLECLTICVVTTKNGFTLVGKSACASPENYDEDLGREIAFEDARKQLWPLEGYALRTRLSAIKEAA